MTDRDQRGPATPKDATVDQLNDTVLALLRGRSPERIAHETGLSRTTVYELLGGKRAVSANSFTKIVNAYAPDDSARWLSAWKDATSSSAPAGPTTVPRQLPFDVSPFIGRTEQLNALNQLDESAGDGAGGRLATITGSPGSGKTALAVRWAHSAEAEFPDGQLYLDLHGYAPGEPLRPVDAATRLLKAMGVRPDADASIDELAAQYRSALAGRRLLVVLDNASDSEQVRPLLPGTPTCTVIVTSRDSLAGIAAGHGALRIMLDVLTVSESLALLRTLVGNRIDKDEPSATKLAALCARLPLALRIAAVHIADSPDTSLRELVDELATESSLLDALETGEDERTAARAVFTWSYRHLADPVARALRLIGLHPGPEIGISAAQAILGMTARHTRRALNSLVRASLLVESAPGRFSAHDLLRAWAAEMAQHHEDEQSRTDALTRLFDYYADTAAASKSTEAGTRWLNIERANLIAATDYLAKHGWHSHLLSLSPLLEDYLATAGFPGHAIELHDKAIRAARALGNTAAEAAAHLALGRSQWRTARYTDAETSFTTAADLFAQQHDRAGQSRALIGLGSVHEYRGDYTTALEILTRASALLDGTDDVTAKGMALGALASVHHARGDITASVSHLHAALPLFQQARDKLREGRALGNLGVAHHYLGQYDEAHACYTSALEIHQELGDQSAEARARLGLGKLADRDGGPTARAQLETALEICRRSGDRDGEASTLSALGTHYGNHGEHDQAQRLLEQARDLAHDIGEREAEAEALNSLGETLRAQGQHQHAQAQHERALDIATTITAKHEQARAHAGIGKALLALDSPVAARPHLKAALDTFEQLKSPETEDLPNEPT